MKQQKGFTLIELLVVIAILGLLSSLAIVSFGGIREKARDTVRLANMNTLHKAMQVMYDNEGTYELAGFDVDKKLVIAEALAVSSVGCHKTAEVSSCQGGKLEEYLPSIRTLKDPSSPEEGCVNNGCSSVCNYQFSKLEKDNYEVMFFLERGTADYSSSGCYSLTKEGIKEVLIQQDVAY